MSDNWLEIYDILNYCISKEVLESTYQREIENCFKILGWRKANNTLLSKISIPIGSYGYIQPDIVLQKKIDEKNNVPVVAIEIKRPNNIKNERQEAQLFSYMRQMRLNYGLYIGENIQLFYDIPDNHDNPISVLSVSITREDKNGDVLCRLFDYENFDTAELEHFCREQYNKKNEKNRIVQRLTELLVEPNDLLKSLLKTLLISEGFDETIIDSELLKINIEVNHIDQLVKHGMNNLSNLKEESKGSVSSQSRDTTKFSFDGGKNYYNKRQFVLAVVKHYVLTHPQITFRDLEKIFYPDIYNSNRGVVKRYEDVMSMIEKSKDIANRYFINEIITLYDGTRVVVNNQWGTKFPDFLRAIQGIYHVVSNNEYKY